MKKIQELQKVDLDIDRALQYLKSVDKDTLYNKICQLDEKQRNEYNKLFQDLNVNNSNDKCSTTIKGKSLEKIVCFILEHIGIFDVKKNFRTHTNELDQLLMLNNIGKGFLASGLIDKRLEQIIGECKNYQNKVSVTYVGKLCSLLMTTDTKIGILFSYKGISGKKWDNACGLVRKFYLCKEKKEDRYCILDFNLEDFKRINEGISILKIIEEKILSLQYDCNYENLINTHDAEQIFNT